MEDFESSIGGTPGTNPFYIRDYIPQVISGILTLAVIIFFLISLSKLFKKMGYSSWKAFIPIYNLSVIAKIGDKSGIYVLLYLIPFVNLYVFYKTYEVITMKLNRDKKDAILLTIIPFIYIPILAFNEKVVCLPEYMHKEQDDIKLDENVNLLDDVNNMIMQDNSINTQGNTNFNNGQVDTNVINQNSNVNFGGNMNAQQNNNFIMDPNMNQFQNNVVNNNPMNNINPNMMQDNVNNNVFDPNASVSQNNINNYQSANDMFDPNMQNNNNNNNNIPNSNNMSSNDVFDPNNM